MAYAQLLRELMPLLRGQIRRKLAYGALQDAEDILQGVMAIARNRVDEVFKCGDRRADHETLVGQPPGAFSDPGKTDTLTATIGALPAGQRQAAEPLKLKELSLRQVATSTGMSISALKVASHRERRLAI